MHDKNLVSDGKQAIVKGSKSFSLASFFFSQEQKEGAWLLYSWCRHVDDEIDQCSDPELAQAKVAEVRALTTQALNNPALASGPYQSLGLIAKKHAIPHQYSLDLIRGLEIDVAGAHITDETALLDYCYCVAGTVGLMMCSIMGVTSPKALPHALAMGQAMQMTNIARDIQDDLKIGRIYLPRTWLAECGLSEESFAQNRQRWFELADRLLHKAEESYTLGLQRLRYLPWRAAWAVIIAAYIYRAIGRKILRQGHQAVERRTYICLREKIWLTLQASCHLLIKKM